MGHDRSLIDPEGRYPSDCPRQVEALAQRVLDLLPGCRVERTRDAIQLDYGGDEGIVVLVTAEALDLRLPSVEWTCGPYGPAVVSRLWKRVSTRDLGDERLAALLTAARRARQRQYQRCRYCGKPVAPEHRIEDDVCHDCASTHLGVVF